MTTRVKGKWRNGVVEWTVDGISLMRSVRTRDGGVLYEEISNAPLRD